MFLKFYAFKDKSPGISTNLLLYEGVIRAIKRYQTLLGVDFDNDAVIGESPVWKCIFNGVKHIYFVLVQNAEEPKTIQKWRDLFNVNIELKSIFMKIIYTTQDARLRWLQYKILYKILPTNCFLKLRLISDTSLCSFCNRYEETLLHFLWDCEKCQKYWQDILAWIKRNFNHCSTLTLSRELIVLGVKPGVKTDRIVDLFILIAKYEIFCSKIQKIVPNVNLFIRRVQHFF